MRKNQIKKTINAIDKNIEAITKNSEQTNEKIDQLIGINKSKLPIILTVIGLVISAIGVFMDSNKRSINDPLQYKIYLSSEYTKLKSYAETDVIAALNFDTSSVNITAYLDSVKSGDSLEMTQKNETEWHKKVFFEESGIYKVIATATAPNGDIIENSVEIEVISAN